YVKTHINLISYYLVCPTIGMSNKDVKGRISLIKQLFVNAAILIAALFIIGQHFLSRPLSHGSPVKHRLFAGAMAGVTGCVLIFFGVQVTGAIVVDFRYISLIVASIYAGPLASLVGGVIIAGFRTFYSGISSASLTGALFVLTAAAGCGLISKGKNGRKTKWILMIIFCQINSFFALYSVIRDYSLLMKVLIFYSLGFITLGGLLYYYSETIALSNSLVRNLKKENKRDFLTGLNNVRSFDLLYNAALQEAQEKSRVLSIVIVDIDHFKRVNDTYGHQAGDSVLKQLGELLRHGCRSFDVVSRNGGEEFSMLLMDCSCKKACEIAERIRKEVEAHKFILPDNKEINITISLGIATYPETAEDNEALYKNADKALYKAKNTGRNRVCYYDENSLACLVTEKI
ncbi:MAG: diguanylate cyclase, partial [Bacillota bacterium]|nr:diguanylate cyclase [Bacillota bacterium]